MIAKIAWKNIWRSPSRSIIVIGAVAVGVWAFIYMMGFVRSMSSGYVNNAVRFQTSHLQLHNPDFVADKDVKFTIDASVSTAISQMPEVEHLGVRTLVNGMIRSSRANRGITIKGITPQEEKELSHIDEKIIEGDYFSTDKKHQVLISETLAEHLKVKLRKKIVLYFQDLNGDVVTGSFRIVGIFKTGNKAVDLSQVFVQRNELNTYLGDADAAHEIAILLKDKNRTLTKTKEKLIAAYPVLKVQDYSEISPDINVFESQIYMVSIVMLFIFMLALVFGIVNTMLMALLERTHELGMLVAIGMARMKIFWMIVLETLFLSTIGAPLGMLLGWATVSWSHTKGIDLSSFSKGIEQFGMDTIIYPELQLSVIVQLTVAVFMTAIVAAVIPAIKAVRTKPLEAIHKL